MSKRQYILYIEDMPESISRIEEYTKKLTFEKFRQNNIVVDAVLRNFHVIGEASNKIPLFVKEKYPEVPWHKMYGLRNLISHEYFGIDIEMIYTIATSNLPLDKKNLQLVLIREMENSDHELSNKPFP